jgi:hypothetical protein
MKLQRENGKVFRKFLLIFSIAIFLLKHYVFLFLLVIGLFQDILFDTMMMDTQH